MQPLFADRRAAGVELAQVLQPRLADVVAGVPPAQQGAVPVVLALPRGGVPVAAQVARRLDLPLDILVVRKIGMPGRPELALGALGSGGASFLDEGLIRRLGVSADAVAAVVAAERLELARREAAYREHRPALEVTGRVAVLVDDGLATGASMRAAALAVRSRGPAAVVAAAPVGPPGATERLDDVCDAVVVAYTPRGFAAVGAYYADFSQTTDEEVRAALVSP